MPGQVAEADFINAIADAVTRHDRFLVQPHAIAGRTTTFPVAPNGQVPVPWTLRVRDSHGMIDLATPARVTIRFPGTYQLTSTFALEAAPGATLRSAHLVINGDLVGDWAADQRYLSLPNNHSPFTLTAERILEPGDFVQMAIFHQHTAALDITTDPIRPQLAVRRVAD